MARILAIDLPILLLAARVACADAAANNAPSDVPQAQAAPDPVAAHPAEWAAIARALGPRLLDDAAKRPMQEAYRGGIEISVARLYAQTGLFADAEAMRRQNSLLDFGLDISLYIAENRALAGDKAGALAAFEAAKTSERRGSQPAPPGKVAARYAKIARAEAKVGLTDAAMTLFSQARETAALITDRDARLATINFLIEQAKDANGADVAKPMIADALRIVRTLDDGLRKIAALQSLPKEEWQAEDIAGAEASFARARDAAEKIRDPAIRAGTLIELAADEAWLVGPGAAKPTVTAAVAALRAMPDTRESALRFRHLIRSLNSEVYLPDPRVPPVLSLAAETAAQAPFAPAVRVENLLFVYEVQAFHDDPSGARTTRNYLKRFAIGKSRDATLFDLARALKTSEATSNPDEIAGAEAVAGFVTEAQRIVDELTDPRDRRNAESRIANAQTYSHDFAGALRTVSRITNAADRAYALTDVARGQLAIGQVRATKTTLVAATKAAASVPNMTSHDDLDGAAATERKAHDFVYIGELEAKAGDLPASRAAFAAARAVAPLLRMISVGEPQQRMLLEIADAQFQAGDRAGALESCADALRLSATLKIWEISLTYALIADAQTKFGDASAAKATLDAAAQRIAAAQAAVRAEDIGLATSVDGEIATTLTNLAQSQVEIGDMAGAAVSFNGALRAAEAIPDKEFVGGNIADVARGLVRASRPFRLRSPEDEYRY